MTVEPISPDRVPSLAFFFTLSSPSFQYLVIGKFCFCLRSAKVTCACQMAFVWRFDEIYYVKKGDVWRKSVVAKHSFHDLISLLHQPLEKFSSRETFCVISAF